MFNDNCSRYQKTTGGFDAQLFDSSDDCIKILNLEGEVIDLNPGGVRALELDDPALLTGKKWTSFWPEDTQALVEAAVVKGLAGERAQFGAFCPTSKGNSRWWEVVVTPIFDEARQVQRLMVVSRDVTEIYQARAKLEEANRRKDEFLALLSHELRNPLSAAGMAAQVLQKQVLTHERVVDIGKLIGRQIQHMSRLAEDLLDMSRVTRGDIRLKLQRVDMKHVVGAVLEQLQGSAAAKGQSMTLLPCEEQCIILGDQTRLIQVVGNIVANAVRYTPPSGTITLALSRETDVVVLAVRDSGMGIEASAIPTLFDMFTQADRSDIRTSGGLGIGLALVRSLLALHGGSVTAFSEGAGRGSTFTVRIPVMPS